MKLHAFRVITATAIAAALCAPASLALEAEPASAATSSPDQVINIPINHGGVGSVNSGFIPLPDSPRAAISGRALLPDDNELVTMPDPVLRAAVLQKVGASTLTRGAIRQLRSLYVTDAGITDLTGLEYATNLDLVDLSKNAITTIEPLRGLANIRQLNVSSTKISDIAPVATMPILDYLQLNWTSVSDLGPVRDHPLIWRIELAGTKVSSLEPVTNLTALTALYFQETPVSDVTPLSGLVNLYALSAPNTQISNLHPVAGLPNLAVVNVNGARVADLSMLDTWPNLRQVGFLNQQVTGIPVVASKTESTYRTTEATTAPFTMLDGVVLTTTTDAATTPEGLTVWSDIPADATGLTATVSGDPLPGSGATYSANLTYPLSRADFTNGDSIEMNLGSVYQFQFSVDASFVTGPFTFVDGSVPGLSLSDTGALTGTPTEEGTFTLDIRRTDAYGNMIDRAYTFVVTEALVVDPVDPINPAEPQKPATPHNPTVPAGAAGSGQLSTTGNEDLSSVLAATILALLVGGVMIAAASRRRHAQDAS
ncbi:hypothetical protein GCM10022198_14890 [Klugiella xanthotipulae]|uniref:Leucine rich repeat (LRR) protein n=1 Tax=Klugiella xanthotipulae TaxID=244735 RepID=A0A543I6N6_9MICO|nr:leucine-rich repeat domain-containing protein [Klugiella xanthotipulae]TQM66219.1 leucine rich repeat (LRR) protein [Klugiella xanthotipulae]